MIGSQFAWAERPFGNNLGRLLKTAIPVLALGIMAGLGISSVGAVNAVFLLAVIPAVALMIWALADPRRGFYVALFILPFIELAKRLLFLGDGVSQTQYLAVKVVPDVIILVALISYVHRDLVRRRLPLAPTVIDKLVLCFLLWNLLEIGNPNSTLLVGLGGFDYTGVPVALYFLARSMIRNVNDLERVSLLVVSTGVIASLYGLKQELFGLAPFEVRWLNSGLTSLGFSYIESAGLLRAFSTFASHKEFGFYLAAAIGFALFLRPRYPIVVFAIPVLLAGLTVTWARDAWSDGLGMLFILILFRLRMTAVLRSMVFLALYTSPILVPLFGPSVMTILSDAQGSTADQIAQAATVSGTFIARIDTWREALAHPWAFLSPIGNGIGTTFVGSRINDQFQFAIIPHNGVLSMSYEIGSLGAILFLVLWGIAWLRISTAAVATERRIAGPLSICLAIQFGILVPDMLINDSFILRPAAVFFWLTLAAAVSLSNAPAMTAIDRDGDVALPTESVQIMRESQAKARGIVNELISGM